MGSTFIKSVSIQSELFLSITTSHSTNSFEFESKFVKCTRFELKFTIVKRVGYVCMQHILIVLTAGHSMHDIMIGG